MSTEARIVIVAALIGAVLLGVALALLHDPFAEPENKDELQPGDPAAYQVAEVLEEARKITREAAE